MTTPYSLEQQVAGSLRRAGLPAGGATLVVAASGGPDSTALLRCLLRLRDVFRLNLHVAHLNHDFRGAEADNDAAFAQRLADGFGLPCSIDKQDPIAYQNARGISSFEQAAREMRYSFLSRVADAVGAHAVALGHTSDDQAETVLLHLLRGAGLGGLRGMSEATPWPWPDAPPRLMLLRPMLGVGKSDTAAYCRALGQTYRQDSGNYLWRFTRNRLRMDLMPKLARDYNPGVREALARLSRSAAKDLDFVEEELTRRWPSIAEERNGSVILRASALGALHPALQGHAMRRAYALVAGDTRSLNERHVEGMIALVNGRAGGRSAHLPRGIRAHRESDTLTMYRSETRDLAPTLPGIIGEHSFSFPQNPGERMETEIGGWKLTALMVEAGQTDTLGQGNTNDPTQRERLIARFDPAALEGRATLRTRRPGDRFQPSGMAGTKKLQDFFTDAKIPREQRDHIPLLVSQRGIAWVVGHRVAGWATAQAGPALWVRVEPPQSQ